jgi:hypothetical protein
MPELTIITNHVPRDVIDAYELTADERADFDYIDWPAVDDGRESATFARYRGELYDLSEYMDASGVGIDGWHGYRPDTFFSGVLVRYCDDHERVIVGRYYS